MKTLDIIEAAEFLKVDRTTALELAGRGELPGAKIGRAWVFLEDDLIDYLRARVREQCRDRCNRRETEEAEKNPSQKGGLTFVHPTNRKRRVPPTLPNVTIVEIKDE